MTVRDTYPMVLGCSNCTRTHNVEVPVGQPTKEFIQENPECPTCKVGGGPPRPGGTVYSPLFAHGASGVFP
jgi:hypothetical protein